MSTALPRIDRQRTESSAPRRVTIGLLAPAIALVLGAVVALSGARGTDWPAHLFRIELFREAGLTLWNGQWYTGHYTLGYSVIYPPLASWFGPMVVGIASSVIAAAAFADLLQRRFGTIGAFAACWFAVGTAVNLAVGRLPFALGLAFGLVALAAYERRWMFVAVVAAPLTSLASPVAGAFLAIGIGAIIADAWLRRRNGEHVSIAIPIAMALLTITPVAAASALFPDPGVFPFRGAAFVGVMASCIGLVIVLPSSERVLRMAAGIAAAAAVPLFLVANPIGGNMTRMVVFFVVPVLAAAMWRSRRRLVIAAGIPLALWMVLPGAAAAGHLDDPAADADYHAPVIDVVEHAGGQPGRVEVPFTAGHWEVAHIAVRGADRPRLGTAGRHGSQRRRSTTMTSPRRSTTNGSTITPCGGSRCPMSTSTRVGWRRRRSSSAACRGCASCGRPSTGGSGRSSTPRRSSNRRRGSSARRPTRS